MDLYRYAVRNSMKFEYVVHKQLSYLQSYVPVGKRQEMSILAQSVHYNQNYLLAFRARHTFNEIKA